MSTIFKSKNFKPVNQRPKANKESIEEKLQKLQQKYSNMGQDLSDYLEGLLQSKGLSYWEYIHLDSLLGLQTQRTFYPDEMIFIVYHQITELYFKLIKHELVQLTDEKEKEFVELSNWHKRIERVNTYMKHLCNSFEIMINGMDFNEFKNLRMALLPASGFQSVQFRHIEIMSTQLGNLLHDDSRHQDDAPLKDLFPKLYWKRGGIDLESQEKTLTLKEFEAQYDDSLIDMIKDYRYCNLSYLYNHLKIEKREDEHLISLLKDFDQYYNVFWRLSHLSAAARHLVGKAGENGESQVKEATGGTNWQKFLPPKFQKIIFFRKLWSEEEINDWGKAAVLKAFSEQISKSWK